MVQISKSDDDKAADRAAEQGKHAAEQAAEASREAAERTADVARRSAEGTAELGRALVDLAQQQTRHNLETWNALGGAVDWGRVLRIQGEYWRVSLERTAQLTQRYLEVSQAVLTAATAAAQDQAKKAA